MDGNYQTQFDFAEQSPVHAVVTTVATIDDSDPTDLPPLANVVDPDTLNVLLTPSENRTIDGSMEFTYCDYRVVVRSDGEVTVYIDPTGAREE